MKTITYDDTLYQLVPKEPTIEQQNEMVDAYFDTRDVVAAYKAGLSAAPTPPAQPGAVRVPLTKEQTDKCWDGVTKNGFGKSRYDITRAIEAAHGITPPASTP